jgi:predicted Fe-Mo cluster-binding NifX family protein
MSAERSRFLPGAKAGNTMKIAISSTGPDLDDLLDPRFGRCRFFIIYNMETGIHEAKKNTAAMH